MTPLSTLRKNCLIKIIPLTVKTAYVNLALMLADAQGVGDFLKEMHEKTFKLHDSFAVGEVFNAKEDELPALSGMTAISPLFLISPLPPTEKVTRAGMTAAALLPMNIRNVIFNHRKKSVIWDFIPISLKTMMNQEG